MSWSSYCNCFFRFFLVNVTANDDNGEGKEYEGQSDDGSKQKSKQATQTVRKMAHRFFPS